MQETKMKDTGKRGERLFKKIWCFGGMARDQLGMLGVGKDMETRGSRMLD